MTCRFKIDMKNLTNFDMNTQKSQKISLQWSPLEQSIYCLSLYREVILMKLKRDTKFGEKLTCRFKIDMKNLTNFD